MTCLLGDIWSPMLVMINVVQIQTVCEKNSTGLQKLDCCLACLHNFNITSSTDFPWATSCHFMVSGTAWIASKCVIIPPQHYSRLEKHHDVMFELLEMSRARKTDQCCVKVTRIWPIVFFRFIVFFSRYLKITIMKVQQLDTLFLQPQWSYYLQLELYYLKIKTRMLCTFKMQILSP